MKRIAVLLALAVVLFSQSALAGGIEPVFGIATDAGRKTLSIEVASSGCTDKGYFSFVLEDGVLTFTRIKRDSCKAMPERCTIVYSLDELGIDPQESFRLGNPISYSNHLY